MSGCIPKQNSTLTNDLSYLITNREQLSRLPSPPDKARWPEAVVCDVQVLDIHEEIVARIEAERQRRIEEVRRETTANAIATVKARLEAEDAARKQAEAPCMNMNMNVERWKRYAIKWLTLVLNQYQKLSFIFMKTKDHKYTKVFAYFTTRDMDNILQA